MTHAQILDTKGIQEVVDCILDGLSLNEIARRFEVRKASLLGWIASDSDRSARVSAARLMAADSHADDAEDLLRNAKGTKVEMSRAKELAHHLRWKASMADPRRFGTKVELSGAVGIHALSAEELDARQAAIDAEIASVEIALTKAASVPAS